MVKSPCIGKCNYDSSLETCADCRRTKQEISTWYVMTDDEKLTVLERLMNKQSNCNGFCGEYECKENKTNCLRKVQEK